MAEQENSNHDEGVIYTIDEQNHLTYVNSGWDKFALENDAAHLEHEKVLNRPLWDFIENAETRHIHQVLAERVRKNQAALKFPFRCDSPSVPRYMNMQIIPQAEGAITYSCTVERIERRAPLLLEEMKTWKSRKLLRMCSWCKKVDIGDNKWMEIEPAIKHLQLLEQKILPEISHTICDDCLHALEE